MHTSTINALIEKTGESNFTNTNKPPSKVFQSFEYFLKARKGVRSSFFTDNFPPNKQTAAIFCLYASIGVFCAVLNLTTSVDRRHSAAKCCKVMNWSKNRINEVADFAFYFYRGWFFLQATKSLLQFLFLKSYFQQFYSLFHVFSGWRIKTRFDDLFFSCNFYTIFKPFFFHFSITYWYFFSFQIKDTISELIIAKKKSIWICEIGISGHISWVPPNTAT